MVPALFDRLANLPEGIGNRQERTRAGPDAHFSSFRISTLDRGRREGRGIKYRSGGQDPRLTALNRRGHCEHRQDRMSVAEHPEPVFPCFPDVSHIRCTARELTPLQEFHTRGGTTDAYVQPRCPVLSRADHGLVARNESKQKYHEPKSQGALWNRKPLPGDGSWRCKTKSIET